MDTEHKDFIIELLNVYRSLPALWDVHCKDYKTLSVKSAQYDRLLMKYQEKYPNATKNCLSRKINILRTNYRREVKRLRELEKSGNKADYLGTNLYYFNAMDFLREIRPSCYANCINEHKSIYKQQPQLAANVNKDEINFTPKKIKLFTPIKLPINKSSYNNFINSPIDNFNESSIDDAEFITDDIPMCYADSINVQTPQLENFKDNIDFTHKNIELITDIKSEISKSSNEDLSNLPMDQFTESTIDGLEFVICSDSMNEHENTHKKQAYKHASSNSKTEKRKKSVSKSSNNINAKIADVWAHELTDMEGRQRLLAKKLINDIIFNGHMGLLNYNTCLTNLNNILSPTNSLYSVYENTQQNSCSTSFPKNRSKTMEDRKKNN